LKQHLLTLLTTAFAQWQINHPIPTASSVDFRLERVRDARHGDFACNIAMLLAKVVKASPRDLAQQMVALLPPSPLVDKVEVAGAGFINFFLLPQAYHIVLNEILTQKASYGQTQIGGGRSVLLEFVSANPTGPLHVGHGRGAAYGTALANLLNINGFKVHREYYVNDAGRQMDILAVSVWLRYLELCGESIPFPPNAYQGDYIWDIAASLHREHRGAFQHSIETVFANLPPLQESDKEAHIDALIARCKQLLGQPAYQQVFQRGIEVILADIRRDLEQFGVVYDTWFSEASLMDNQTVQRSIEQLRAQGHLYEQDGAWWFRSSAFGDEKDRVVVRENGQTTYFASDIAYHLNKLERGFDLLINIWGADHHGYIPRLKAVMTALGADANRLTVLLVQFATLYRGKERLQMSTRSGEFITLRELREEVGRDATRFFYIQRKSEQHLDFDLELAKSHSLENPVYYIQYAHARIASVMRELQERQFAEWSHTPEVLFQLSSVQERNLLVTLSRYPEVLESAARAYEPHQVVYYLQELAQNFHTFYNEHKILVVESDLRNARLSLMIAVQQVLRNGLTLIGVSAPEVM